MDLKTVVVTWMDGPVATYANATISDVNGTLIIYLYDDQGRGPVSTWRFPSHNIRACGSEPWIADREEDVG